MRTRRVGWFLVLMGCTATPPGGPEDAAASDAHADARDAASTGDAGCDADGDGHRASACGGDDCDDADAQRYPGHTEVCDATGHDEDCDSTTFGVLDADGDGAPDASCCNADGTVMHCGTDCDDHHAGVHPSAPEVCNEIDDDCDDGIDEAVLITFHRDVDGDGFGSPTGMTMMGCNPPVGYVFDATDCDDTYAQVHVGAPDPCNCTADTPYDSDHDGHVTTSCGGDDCVDYQALVFAGAPAPCGCGAPGTGERPFDADMDGHFAPACGGDDCDDSAMMVFPGSGTCGCGATHPYDVDGDGYASIACTGTDCDDTMASVHPGAAELCNARDDNCDSHVDEAPPLACSPSVGGPACTTACGVASRTTCLASTCTLGTTCADPTLTWPGNDPALTHQSGTASGTSWCSVTAGTFVVVTPGTTAFAAGPHTATFVINAGLVYDEATLEVYDADAGHVLASQAFSVDGVTCRGSSACTVHLAFVAPSCHRIEVRVHYDNAFYQLCVDRVSIGPS